MTWDSHSSKAAGKNPSLCLQLVHLFLDEIPATSKLQREQVLETLQPRNEAEQAAMAQGSQGSHSPGLEASLQHGRDADFYGSSSSQPSPKPQLHLESLQEGFIQKICGEIIQDPENLFFPTLKTHTSNIFMVNHVSSIKLFNSFWTIWFSSKLYKTVFSNSIHIYFYLSYIYLYIWRYRYKIDPFFDFFRVLGRNISWALVCS